MLREKGLQRDRVTTINPHALADFMVEYTIDNQEVGGQEVVPQEGKGLEKENPEAVLKEYGSILMENQK